MSTSKDAESMLAKRIENGREYRDAMEFRALETDEGAKVVEGYATTFGDPYVLWEEPGYRVLEQIDRHAFDDADKSDVIMQYDHAGRVFARQSNGTLQLDEDDHGLHIRADLSGTEIGRQLYQEIRDGYTNKMSFAFRIAEDRRDIEENHETGMVTVMRTVTRISKLYDVSAVSIPANPATNIAARAYGEGVIAEVKAERQRAEEEAKAINELRARIRIRANS